MNDNDASIPFEVIDGHIALVRLNRPDSRNAVTGEMTRAVVAAVEGPPALVEKRAQQRKGR